MPIQFNCTGCGKRYSVGDQFAGKKANCKACGAQMNIPAGTPAPAAAAPASFEDAAAAAEEEYGPIAVAPPPVSAAPVAATAFNPASAPRVTRFPGGAGDVLPSARKKTSSAGPRVGFRINRLVIALIVFGCIVLFWGFNEWRLSSASGSTPQNITCAQLEKNGPGANAYVHLTNFVITPGTYIYKYNKNNPSAAWEQVWVPVLPKDGAYIQSLAILAATGQVNEGNFPKPKNIKVIVRSKNLANQNDVENLNRRGNVTGVVVNKIESLSNEERNHLQASYPGSDISQCWIVDDGREPASPAKSWA